MTVTQNALDLVSQSTVVEEKTVEACERKCCKQRKCCQFCGDANLMTMSWWVLSASPLGLADVIARGPVMSQRWLVTVWSGTRIMMLSLVPTRSYAGPTPVNMDQTGELR